MKSLIKLFLPVVISLFSLATASAQWTILEKNGPTARYNSENKIRGLDWDCGFTWATPLDGTLYRGKLILQQQALIKIYPISPDDPNPLPIYIPFWHDIDESPVTGLWSGTLGGYTFIHNEMYLNKFRLKLLNSNAPGNPADPLNPAWVDNPPIYSNIWTLKEK